MCGRYALFTAPDELEKYFEAIVSRAGTIEPNYNVTPGMMMPVVAIGRENVPVITTFRWGLIPNWAKDPAVGYKMMNARSETISEKPSFAMPFERRRCVIPSNGFYEWLREGKSRIPHFVRREDDVIMTYAGIYDRWRSPEGADVFSYSIITTTANERIKHIHERMPVVLNREDVRRWLHPETPLHDLQALMQPLPDDKTRVYRVSDEVNKPANNHAGLLDEQKGGPTDGETLSLGLL
ncbi:MAG: SOS response-associated peptidase [Balneolales bacterium]|nr:SOS response-associated peptidase [Balneolales bacterium]